MFGDCSPYSASVPGQHVREVVAGRCRSPHDAEDQAAVRVAVARLAVVDPLVVGAGLHRVRAGDLGHVLRARDQPLRGEQDRIEAARVEHRRPVAPAGHRRDLVEAAVVDARVGVAERRARHLARIRELVREVDVGRGERRLGRQRRAEDVGQAGRRRVRAVGRRHRGRVRHLVGVAPPQADREVLRLGLQVVAGEDARVVADVDVDARQPLVHVLVELDALDVVVAAGQRRVGVRPRQQTQQPLAVRIDLVGRDAAVDQVVRASC